MFTDLKFDSQLGGCLYRVDNGCVELHTHEVMGVRFTLDFPVGGREPQHFVV